MGEPARLDLQRGVKRHQRTFIHGRQQRLGRRIGAHRVPRHHGRGADIGLKPRRRIGRAAGHLVILAVPGLDKVRLRRRQNPGAGPGKQISGGDNLVHQPGHQRRLGVRELALQQKRRRRHCAHLPNQPCRAARAGEDADLDLGQADLGAGVVGDDDPVTGQRQLQPDPHRRARQCRDHRLAAFERLGVHSGPFDLPQQPVDRHHPVENRLRWRIPARRLHLGNGVQIHPARKILLGRGDDDALHRRIGQGTVKQRLDLGKACIGHDIHRLARHIPGQDRHAVGACGAGEIAHHFVSLGQPG